MAQPENGERSSMTTVEQELADELLRIHLESYGKGAGTARVHYLDDTVIALLDELELLPNEEFLIGAGKGDAVVEVRSRYQQAIETTFRAAVERATGRRVVSFVSATKLAPNWVIEVFRLGPRRSADD
jgi:uncharacterized protein YbcI